jgi:hypothetical protein
MPKIHEYRDGKGLYIKASHRGRITTYQVTLEGAALLRRHGHGEGTALSPRDLNHLINNGYAFTGGSGPGVIGPPLPPAPPPSPAMPQPPRQAFGTHEPAPVFPPGCWLLLLALVIGGILIATKAPPLIFALIGGLFAGIFRRE